MPLHVPETLLSRIWEEQRLHSDSLMTSDGRTIQVIRRGQKNVDNGPDFKHALVRIGSLLIEGDIELHLHDSDWHAHGHDSDPAYNHTILHVVLWESPQARNTQIFKANGESVPGLTLQDHLAFPLDTMKQIFEQADERKEVKFEQCRMILADIPDEQLLARLQHLGRERLYERAGRFDLWLQEGRTPEQLLYEAICEGLGYSSNKAPFLRLARILPLQTLLTHLPEHGKPLSHRLPWIQAMLFGAAGLLPECPHSYDVQTSACSDPESREYITELHSLWNMLLPCLDLHPMAAEEWHFFRLRPPNFPTRRLVALSYLVLNYSIQPLFDGYTDLFGLVRSHPDPLVRQVRLLERSLEIPAAGYWKGRYNFGKAKQPERDRMLLGSARIRDILISAVFPVMLLYALRHSGSAQEKHILELYARFPAPEWSQAGKRIFQQALAHREIPSKQVKTAAVYQGMLQLYKHYCYLPACSNCVLGNHSKKVTISASA